MPERLPYDAYEFGKPDLSGTFVSQDNVIIPVWRLMVRGQRADGQWDDLGLVELTLTKLKNPPPDHAPVAVTIVVATHLRAVAVAWDGATERRQGERRHRRHTDQWMRPSGKGES